MVTWDDELNTKTTPVFADEVPIIDSTISTGVSGREKLATLDSLPYTIQWSGENMENDGTNDRYFTPGTSSFTTDAGNLDPFEIVIPTDGKLIQLCAFSHTNGGDDYDVNVVINQVDNVTAALNISLGSGAEVFHTNSFSVDVVAGDRLLLRVDNSSQIYADIPVTLVGQFQP